MLDQLFQLIQQNSQQAVVENPAVPNEHNEQVMQEAHKAIENGLSNMASNPGQIEELKNSLQNGEAKNNPAVQQISGNFMGSIMEKFGIDSHQASGIAGSIIPAVLEKLGGKAGQGGIDFSNSLSSLNKGSIGNIAGKLGLDKDKDGDVDFDDLKKLF